MKSSQLAVSLAFVALCSTGEAQKPADPDSGIVYETTSTTSMDGMPFASQVERTRTTETPRGIRIDVLERSGPGAMLAQRNPAVGAPGSYRLAIDGGRRMIVVDTVKREYYEMNYAQMAGMGAEVSKMMTSMGMKMSAVGFDAKDLGDGGVILGHPTTHWKTHQTMTTSMQVEGDTVAMTADMFIDTWYATDVKPVTPQGPLNSYPGELDSAAMSMMRGVMGESAEKILENYKRMPRTIPLKVEIKGSMNMGEMDVMTGTTREVTKLERGKFDPALFEVPKGYKPVDNPMKKLLPSTSKSPDKQF